MRAVQRGPMHRYGAACDESPAPGGRPARIGDVHRDGIPEVRYQGSVGGRREGVVRAGGDDGTAFRPVHEVVTGIDRRRNVHCVAVVVRAVSGCRPPARRICARDDLVLVERIVRHERPVCARGERVIGAGRLGHPALRPVHEMVAGVDRCVHVHRIAYVVRAVPGRRASGARAGARGDRHLGVVVLQHAEALRSSVGHVRLRGRRIDGRPVRPCAGRDGADDAVGRPVDQLRVSGPVIRHHDLVVDRVHGDAIGIADPGYRGRKCVRRTVHDGHLPDDTHVDRVVHRVDRDEIRPRRKRYGVSKRIGYAVDHTEIIRGARVVREVDLVRARVDGHAPRAGPQPGDRRYYAICHRVDHRHRMRVLVRDVDPVSRGVDRHSSRLGI